MARVPESYETFVGSLTPKNGILISVHVPCESFMQGPQSYTESVCVCVCGGGGGGGGG